VNWVIHRTGGWRMQWENALHARAKTHAAHGKRCAAGPALLGNHHTFKSLNAFLDLFPFAFQQAYVHFYRVAGTKIGEVCAQLRFM